MKHSSSNADMSVGIYFIRHSKVRLKQIFGKCLKQQMSTNSDELIEICSNRNSYQKHGFFSFLKSLEKLLTIIRSDWHIFSMLLTSKAHRFSLSFECCKPKKRLIRVIPLVSKPITYRRGYVSPNKQHH